MNQYADRFQSDNFQNDPNVIVGLHDGRLIENSSFEISERLINRLQFIAKGYELHMTALIDSYGDIMFNNKQCENLIIELSFIKQLVNDSLLYDCINNIIELAYKCIRSNNRRIHIFFGGN